MATSATDGAPGGRTVVHRTFTLQDQRAFAELSGDVNPLHMDALAARRTEAGEPVVHGVHVLIWALDALAADGMALHTLNRVKVEFRRFVLLERDVCVRVERDDHGSVRVMVLAETLPVMKVDLKFGPRHGRLSLQDQTPIAADSEPAVLDLFEMESSRGWLSPPVTADAFARVFPAASAALHPRRLSGLAQTSRLVGMVCPGLHSLYARLELELSEELGTSAGLCFSTVHVHHLLRWVEMDVAGDGLRGQVSAFARHPPVEAPGMAAIADRVNVGAFRGTTTLVAGGSRGIGAATAKILAAGGGRVIVTYARGHADAEQLRDEINAAMGADVCLTQLFDALDPAGPQLGALAGVITHLYYMATPQIFAQASCVFDAKRFALFTQIYVNAFHDVCAMLKRDRLSVFYPSSTAVEERPNGMTEYAMAKAAGEMLCADMAASGPGLTILVRRLPRILTDQTATVAYAESADPIDIMMPLIRQVQSA